MNGSLLTGGHFLLNLAGFGQVLDQPHPFLFLILIPRGGVGDLCFSFSPISILTSTAIRGLSASCSVPSPPSSFWPRRHLLSRIQHERFTYFSCIVNTFLVILIKLLFVNIFVSYCDYVHVFYNFINTAARPLLIS